MRKTHGLSGSPTFRVWCEMRRRCSDPKRNNYARYGGRGISVCPAWLGVGWFLNFLADMGERPPGHSLDRVDNDGDYTPDNCRWATLEQQGRNKRNSTALTFAGETHTLVAWAEKTGIPPYTLRNRLRRGDSPARILDPQPHHGQGEAHPLAKLKPKDVLEIRARYARGDVLQRELAEVFGVTRRTVGDIVGRRSWRHL